MSLLPLFLLWFHTVLSQDQWRLVHPDGSVEAVCGTPRLGPEKRVEVVRAWVWSGLRAPRRVSPDQIGREKLPDDSGRLAVHVARRASGKPPDDLRLVAAPFEMWREVPEAALPSWPVPRDGLLAIPFDQGRTWRLRVAGHGQGSWWVTVRPGQKSVVLTSSPAAGIEIAVLDAAGKKVPSLNGSLQEAAARGGNAGFWAKQHGEAGGLAVPGLPDEEDVSLIIMAAGMPPLVVRGRPSSLPHQVRLAAGAELTGRLVDIKGVPVAGVPVEAEAFASGELPQVMAVKGRSGADGAWRLRGLPTGKVAWSARAAGFVPLTETVDVQGGVKTDLGARTLEPGTTLAVKVIDDSGAVVPGARVKVEAGRFTATADVRGVALLEGLPAAPVEVKGIADGHLAGRSSFNLPFPQDPHLLLRRAFVVTGRLIDASGSPILRGIARLDSASCRSEVPLREGGRFQLDLPPLTGAAELVLRSPTTQELRLHLEPGQAGDTRDLGDLTALGGLAVTGRVVRSDDGSPVSGARVWTTRQGPDGPAVAWAARDVLEAAAEEDGRFQLSGLLPIPATLRVEAAGLARTQLSLSLDSQATSPGQGATIDLGTIALTAGATLHVRVDSRLRDVQGAVARADLRNRWLEPDMITAQVWDGQAVLANVPAGNVRVSVTADCQLLCERLIVVSEGSEQDVDCKRSGLVVSGLVQVGGAPASDGTVGWSAPDSEMPGRIDTVVSPGGLKQFHVVGAGRPAVRAPVGADGRFETDELTPGRWLVSWNSQGSVSKELVVDVPPGDRFDTVLSFPGLSVIGTVTDRDGKPAEGARVRDLISGALAFTHADGSFSLVGLKSGKVVLQAQLLEHTSPLSELDLRDDQAPEPQRLVLGDRKSSALSLQVADAAGMPVPGAFVFLEEEGKGLRLVVADATGRASVALDPPLAPRVRAATFCAGAWGFGNWVNSKTADQGLAVGLGGAGSLVVRSSKRQGSPRIVTQDGWDVSWLLRLLGAPPVLSPERPMQITGLTAGQYSVSLDGASVVVSVTSDHLGEGRLE